MSTQTKDLTPLFLSLTILTPSEQRRKTEFLREKLNKGFSLDEIAEKELDVIYSLSLSKDSPRQRYYKNLFLVYARSELKRLLLTAYNAFVTPSIIKSVFPSRDLKVEEGSLSRVMVYLVDSHMPLELEGCTAAIDGQLLTKPTKSKKCLIFTVQTSPGMGRHRLSLKLTDITGAETEYQSEFEIIESTAEERNQYWREKGEKLREKLATDKEFQKLLLTDARAAFAEVGLPLNRALSSVFPPPFPDEHADFFTTVYPEMVPHSLDSLKQRIFGALDNRDNERIARILEKLGRTELLASDGTLTQNTKDTFSQIFQDPFGFLENLGVIPTEEEKKYIFPAFPKETADAFAEWISVAQSGRSPEASKEQKTRLRQIARQVPQDSALLYRWLTDPQKTFQELYPDATARDLLSMPAPLPDEEAKQLAYPEPISPVSAPENAGHNSSDLIVGFSFALLNKIIYFYFSTLAPPPLPKRILATPLPPPYENIKCEINIDLPGNLSVVDPAANLVSLTGSGDATAILEDGSEYSFTLALTPLFSFDFKENKIFLNFNDIDVQISTQGVEVDDPAISAAIKNFIEDAVRTNFPNGEIFLGDQMPMEINLPFADVAVDLHRIVIWDDKDPYSSGELLFSIGIDGKKYLFGQYDVDSGSAVELGSFDSDGDSSVSYLGRQYRLKKGDNAFLVEIGGVDRDFGWGFDYDDSMGFAGRFHTKTSPGTYALIGETYENVNEWYEDARDVFINILCTPVNFLREIINFCGRLLGYETVIEERCGPPPPKYEWIKNYMLEYSISSLSEYAASIILTGYQIRSGALYLSFDFSIPKVNDRLAKTNALEFITGPSDLGIAVSENLLDKILRAWWKYSEILRTFTSDPNDRLKFIHLDFDQPMMRLLPYYINGLFAGVSVVLDLAISGQAGLNVGPLTIRLGIPNHAMVGNFLRLQRDPARSDQYQLVLFIENISTSGAPSLEQFLYDILLGEFYNWEPEKDKQSIIMDLSQNLKFGIEASSFSLNPLGLATNDNEIITQFSMEMAPILRVDRSAIDFTDGSHTQSSITLFNDGNIPLEIGRVSIDDEVFSFTTPQPAPFFIPPGASVNLTVIIEPFWVGRHEVPLKIESNDRISPILNILLIALDIPRLSVDHQLDFGSREPDPNWDRSEPIPEHVIEPKDLVINNTGHRPLEITVIDINNDNFYFDEPPELPLTIPVLSKRDIKLICASNSEDSGTIKIESSDPDKPTVIVNLNCWVPTYSDPYAEDEMYWENLYRKMRYPYGKGRGSSLGSGSVSLGSGSASSGVPDAQ